jgi:hypothetical protein
MTENGELSVKEFKKFTQFNSKRCNNLNNLKFLDPDPIFQFHTPQRTDHVIRVRFGQHSFSLTLNHVHHHTHSLHFKMQ